MLVATNIVDLEHVALVSVVIALLVQICPAVLLVTSGCVWLRPWWTKIVALLLVVMPPIAEEIWLSPVTSQYHLMVCTVLILTFEAEAGRIGIFRNLLLAIAGLTGPGPALAVPLFILRAVVDRSRVRAIQAATLSAGALIEIAVFYTYPASGRHLGISVPLLLCVIYVKHLLVPMLGNDSAALIAQDIAQAFKAGQWPFLPIIASSSALIVLTIAALTAGDRSIRWLCAGALTMMAFSYFGALGGQEKLIDIYFGGRYYYAPQVLVSLTLLGVASTGPFLIRWPALMLIGWLAFVGIQNYGNVRQEMARGPSWREQIIAWKTNPDLAIVLWPRTIQIDLKSPWQMRTTPF
jgi:hypothetical protein